MRIEVESALKRNVPMGAVLIDGASMPRAEQLPESMRSLVRRNAAFVDAGRDFHVHMDRLIADLDGHLKGQIGGVGGTAPAVAGGDPAANARSSSPEGGGAHKVRAGSGEGFRDVAAPWCPEMVVAPAGAFMMGTARAEIDKLCKEYNDWADRLRAKAPSTR